MKNLLFATILILLSFTSVQSMESTSTSETTSESSDESYDVTYQERLDELIESNKTKNPALALTLESIRDTHFPRYNNPTSHEQELYSLTELLRKKKSPFYISALHKQGRVIMPSLEMIDTLLREACSQDKHDVVEFLMLEAGGNNTAYAQELVRNRLARKDFVNAIVLVETYKIPTDLAEAFMEYFTKKMTPRDERSRKSGLMKAYEFIKNTRFKVDSTTADSYYVLAVKNYHEKLVDYFLECGASKQAVEEDSGNNALHALIRSGYPSCTLLETIFKPELLFQENRQGKLPMDYFDPHPEDAKQFTTRLVDRCYQVIQQYMYHPKKRIVSPTFEQKIGVIKQRLTSDRFVGKLDPLSDSLNKKIAVIIHSRTTHDHSA